MSDTSTQQLTGDRNAEAVPKMKEGQGTHVFDCRRCFQFSCYPIAPSKARGQAEIFLFWADVGSSLLYDSIFRFNELDEQIPCKRLDKPGSLKTFPGKASGFSNLASRLGHHE